MPIMVNAPAEHTFAEPLGLLSDCHRRVEKFLGIICTVARQAHGGEMNAEQRAGLETAVRYFRKAAPMHTADEEASLFPRMRASDNPEVAAAMERIDELEEGHKVADVAHERVNDLSQKWLDEQTLNEADAAELLRQAEGLVAFYEDHIALEDNVIFPLAGRTLDHATLAEVGREMAERRGVDPDASTPTGRCGSRQLAPGFGATEGKPA